MTFVPGNLGYIWNASGSIPNLPGCKTINECETYCKSFSNCIGYNFGEATGGCLNNLGSCYPLVKNDLQQSSVEGYNSYLLIPNSSSSSNSVNVYIIVVLIVIIILLLLQKNNKKF